MIYMVLGPGYKDLGAGVVIYVVFRHGIRILVLEHVIYMAWGPGYEDLWPGALGYEDLDPGARNLRGFRLDLWPGTHNLQGFRSRVRAILET